MWGKVGEGSVEAKVRQCFGAEFADSATRSELVLDISCVERKVETKNFCQFYIFFEQDSIGQLWRNI
jgi:hypothetical protein